MLRCWCCRSPEATAAYSSFLREEVLAPSDADPSAGFSLHVADIIVQELQSACEDAPVPAPALQVHSAAHAYLQSPGKKVAYHETCRSLSAHVLPCMQDMPGRHMHPRKPSWPDTAVPVLCTGCGAILVCSAVTISQGMRAGVARALLCEPGAHQACSPAVPAAGWGV